MSPPFAFEPPRRAAKKSFTPVTEVSSEEVLAPTAAALPSPPLAPPPLPPALPWTDAPVLAAKAEPWHTPAVCGGPRAAHGGFRLLKGSGLFSEWRGHALHFVKCRYDVTRLDYY